MLTEQEAWRRFADTAGECTATTPAEPLPPKCGPRPLPLENCEPRMGADRKRTTCEDQEILR